MHEMDNEIPVTISLSRGRSQSLIAKYNSKIPARAVLYFLSWSGFLVSFMMRNDINFALNAMTNTTTALTVVKEDIKSVLLNDSSSIGIQIESDKVPETFQYDWSSNVKSVIISSFYWCYVLSQVVGGIATQYFGTKRVFGWSQFATAICSLCIPAASNYHFSLVIILRSIQGFASGLTWPSMYAVVGYWIPLAERSRFMSSFQGFSIGIGLTYPLCGFLIKNFGWHYVFYTTGSLGISWCILWYFFAFNTPKEHPRITSEELSYIEENISAEIKNSEDIIVPWKSILCSLPAWAIGITTFGRIWIHYVFIVSGPSFMKNILNFDYQKNGFLSGMPFICSYISSVFFCYAADKIMLRRYMNLTNIRKMFTALSQVIPGLLLCWIGYIDKNVTLLLLVWFVAVAFITASYAGAMANIVDIAPNLAGPVLAFCQTIHMSASFLSPIATGLIVINENSIEQWRMVFWLSSIISIVTYLFFQLCGTADIQKWNFRQRPQNLDEKTIFLNKNNTEHSIKL